MKPNYGCLLWPGFFQILSARSMNLLHVRYTIESYIKMGGGVLTPFVVLATYFLPLQKSFLNMKGGHSFSTQLLLFRRHVFSRPFWTLQKAFERFLISWIEFLVHKSCFGAIFRRFWSYFEGLLSIFELSVVLFECFEWILSFFRALSES